MEGGISEGAEPLRRAFADFKVYKGKAALSMRPIRPTWKRLPDGGASIDRTGTMLLEFAPVGSVERQYDWSKKQTFAMSASEIGTVVAAPNTKNEFFHDPGKGRTVEGMVHKVLRVEPTPDGKGYFFSVNVTDKANGNSNISIPLSIGEFFVFKTLCEYALPRLMGFDELFNISPQMQAEQWGHDGASYSGGFEAKGEPAYPAAAAAFSGTPTGAQQGQGTRAYWDQMVKNYVPPGEEEEPSEFYQPSPDSADFRPPSSDRLSPPSTDNLPGRGGDGFDPKNMPF